MKNIIKILFLFLVSAGFTSCNEEVGYPDPGPAGNPEKEIQGVYSGSMTMVNASTGAENTGMASITFTPGQNAYITDVKVECADLNVNLQSVANVVNFSEGYKFYNEEVGNGFGVKFDGTVINGVATIKFTISKKVGLKQTIYNYSFSGNKN